MSIAIPAANTAGLKNGAIIQIGIVQAGATGNHDITIGAVQFEADRQIAGAWNNSTAFEFRPLPLELAMCQRYFEVASVLLNASVPPYITYSWKVPKRAAPTLTLTPGSGTGGTVSVATGADQTLSFYQNTAHSVNISSTVTGSAEL